MRPTYESRMQNLAKVVRHNAHPGSDDIAHEKGLDSGNRPPETQAEYLIDKGLKAIARHEVAVNPTVLEKAINPTGVMEQAVEGEIRRLMIEGMLRVIDDRRQDPDYLASMKPRDRQALEDPYATLQEYVEEKLQMTQELSQGWGEPGTPDAPGQ